MADDVTQPGAGSAPVADDNASGMDLLQAAFASPPAGDGAKDAGTEPSASEEPAADESAPTPQALQQLSEEDLGKALQDPRVVFQLRQTLAQRDAQMRSQWEMERVAERSQEEEALLSDEEIGARVRRNAEIAPVLTSAQAQGYARAQQDMLRLGIGDVMEKVPELKGLTQEERAVYDPLNPRYGSMGDYFNALVDVAASKRAEKLATKRAKELADALVKDKTAELRKGLPNTAGPSGQGRDVARFIDVDRMSGREILNKAFGA